MNVIRPVAIGLGTLAVSAFLGGCGGTEQASKVVVPNLIGKDATSAQKLLAQRGLSWRWEEGTRPRPSNGFLMADTIEGQTLAGQRVRRGSVIGLVPSSTKLVVTLPLG